MTTCTHRGTCSWEGDDLTEHLARCHLTRWADIAFDPGLASGGYIHTGPNAANISIDIAPAITGAAQAFNRALNTLRDRGYLA